MADTMPKSILRSVYNNESAADQSQINRIMPSSGLSRHRGVSPVRVRRSINESLPTAVVTPTPPIHISTRTVCDAAQRHSITLSNETGHNRYFSFSAMRNGFVPTSGESAGSSSVGALSRRSRSSAGSSGLGLVSRKLDYDQFEHIKQLDKQCAKAHWLCDNLDGESQVPSNSILTLHSLDETRNNDPASRDDSQERRMIQLEARLREIEKLVANGKRSNCAVDGSPKTTVRPAESSDHRPPRRTSTPTPYVASPGNGILSVALPPMMSLDAGIYRVQPKTNSETKTHKEMERLQKKLKHQEEICETIRAQHLKQIEQLTRQLAANDDMTQTLRSRIRELELENELWQNRFRLYNDVDVAKILRENERLRTRLRKRSSNGEGDEEKIELIRKKEQVEEENEKLRIRFNELEQKYRTVKEKYKDTVKSYKTKRRQDHVELEGLKVIVELQNTELEQLRSDQAGIMAEEAPATVARESLEKEVPQASFNTEFVDYNLEKCKSIVECLSNICTRLKHRQPLDPDEVLGNGIFPLGERNQKDKRTVDKPIDAKMEELANRMTFLHSLVVDLYGDDLANSVTCNVQ